jgi:hypothetical protein
METILQNFLPQQKRRRKKLQEPLLLENEIRIMSVAQRKDETVHQRLEDQLTQMNAQPQKQTESFLRENQRETAEDTLRQRDKDREDNYWQKIDRLFYGTIIHAETAFRINIILNIIVAGVGLSLLTYAIAYSWVYGLDLYATAFGSLGVASFVAIFYFTPQRKIQRTTGDLAQLQMLYRSYCMQAEEVNDLCFRYYPKTIEELEKIDNHLTKLTIEICDKIEAVVGEKDS